MSSTDPTPPPAAAAAATEAPAEAKGPSKNELKKLAKEAEKKKKEAERKEREERERKEREAANVDYAKDKYGDLKPQEERPRPEGHPTGKRDAIASLAGKPSGTPVFLRARVQTSRAAGAKLVFLTLRDTHSSTVQALFNVTPEGASKQMVKWATAIPSESIVLVIGELKKPDEEIQSCSVKDVEVKIHKIYVEARAPAIGAINFADAARPEEDFRQEDSQYVRVNLDTRLDHRVIDLRTPTNRAIFKIQSAVSKLFRDYLGENDFTEIHSPKLQGAATESGSSVFEVKYFNGKAYLAQSPQLAKQMCIAADMGRVYEVGPVFRAENSNTPRHMTEFTGLDLEMEINDHYHEVLNMLDGLFLRIFSTLKTQFAEEIKLIGKQHESEEFLLPEDGKTLRLTYKEATDLLRADGQEIGEDEDMSTEQEKRLGRIIRDKYKTDYYIIDEFPLAIRPFYTMPHATNPKLSNSYDFFMRGQEILSGAQRVHDADLLESRMKEAGVDPHSEGMSGYFEAFRNGCPPHGGGGIGLERVVQFYLNLGDIRRASLFPRDPRRLRP